MKILKEAQGGQPAAVTEEDLALINRLARRELKKEEVYVFSLRLCDNEVDRDNERFAPQTLEELGRLFVGKSGIFDHQWSARGQAARIDKTQVVRQPQRLTRAGDGYCWLKGWAYMARTDSAKDLIAEIEAGIKKEVSVGCAVERAVCSICGEPMDQCPHEKGENYGGAECWAELTGAADAYEWSFVAVPAQPMAGVIKAMDRDGRSRLEREAALGRKYLQQLRQEVVRLGGLSGLELEHGVLCRIARALEEPELDALRRCLERQADRNYPVQTQLHYDGGADRPDERDGAFRI